MTAEITRYKDSGKWYETIDMEIPDNIPCFEPSKIKKHIESVYPSFSEFNYTINIDEGTKWLKHLIINTK